MKYFNILKILANGCGQLRIFDPRENKPTTICHE